MDILFRKYNGNLQTGFRWKAINSHFGRKKKRKNIIRFCRDLNQGPFDYKAEVIPLSQRANWGFSGISEYCPKVIFALVWLPSYYRIADKPGIKIKILMFWVKIKSNTSPTTAYRLKLYILIHNGNYLFYIVCYYKTFNNGKCEDNRTFL